VRAVTLGPTVGGESVVADRLRPGERVVTDGQVRLTPGAKVQLRDAAPAARAETAS
jgi:multidrug efflux system membrane fusion protein